MVLLILEDAWSALPSLNPFLSPQDAKGLLTKMIDWMLLESEIEIYAKAEKEILELLDDLKNDSGMNIDSSIDKLALLLDTRKHYIPSENPRFLAFEYLSKLTLRKPQVEKIQNCLTFEQSHQIIKLMMGEGKTTVIVPYLAKMLANGKVLPIILAPHSVYQEYLKDLKSKSQQLLNQPVFTFEYQRSSSTHIDDLNRLGLLLQTALSSRGLLIVTAETLKSLLLKYVELAITEQEILPKGDANVEDLTQRRITLGNIIQFIRNVGFALIDEGHLALKSLLEMNFTLCSHQPISQSEIQTILRIYKNLVSMNFDFSTPLQHDISVDDSAQFENERQALISRMYPSPHEKPIRDYLLGINPDYIYQVRRNNPTLADEISLVKKQLHKIIPFTLAQALNYRYGRNLHNKDIEYAIPYIAAKKPSPLSEFGHRHVAINNTVQMLLQEGLLEKQFSTWIFQLKKHWVKNIANMPEKEADAFVWEFLPGVLFKELDLNNRDVFNKLYEKFKKNTAIIFDYLENTLIPGMKFNTKKLNANGQDLGDFFFQNVVLLSGTPYNRLTYPEPFQSGTDSIDGLYATHSYEDDPFMAELFAEEKISDSLSDEDIRLFYTLSLEKNGRIDNVKTESSERAWQLIKEFDSQAHHTNLAAFIDQGAYFKDFSNSQVAQMILDALDRIEGVVYFEDDSNTLMCLTKNSKVPENYVPGKISLSKLFAFFDNMHTFAADINLHDKAHAIVSFHQETCLFELLQAVKRMRKLEKSQTVSYVVSNPLKKRLIALMAPAPLSIEALYIYAMINQAKIVQKEVIISTLHQLKHLVKKKYLEAQLQSKDNLLLAQKICVDEEDFSITDDGDHKVYPSQFFNNYFKALTRTITEIKIDPRKSTSIIDRAVKLLPEEIEDTSSLNKEVHTQEERKVEVYVEPSTTFEPSLLDSWGLLSLYTSRPQVYRYCPHP